MLIIILHKVTPGLRGELSRWLIEAHTGVFVGKVSAMVRDKLWEKCCDKATVGGVLQIWSTNNEQGFQMRLHGDTQRQIIDLDGLQFISTPLNPKNKDTPKLLRQLHALGRDLPTPPPTPDEDDGQETWAADLFT